MATLFAGAPSRIRREGDDHWLTAERLLAVFAVVMVGARIEIGGNLVLADPLAWALVPLWVPVLRRYRGATALMLTGLAALVSCYVLSRLAVPDHRVSMKLNAEVMKVLASALTSVGLLLWARERLHLRHIFLLFGIGLLIAGPSSSKLFAENPWKFGFSVPLTIAMVGYVAAKGRSRLTIGLLSLFALICTITDARSNLAVLLLTIMLLVWRLAPTLRRRRRSVLGTLAVLAGLAVASYYALQAAILDGALGEETRRRSVEQLRVSGSLLLGGRPELGASGALFRHRPQGFGGGTYLNTTDLLRAKTGMASLNYDPNNGYVERFMFGRGIELHSTAFDLWAWCGVAGLVFAAVVAGLVFLALGSQLNVSPVAGAVTIFCALMTLWNLAFSPFVASLPLLVLVLATGLLPRGRPGLRRGEADEIV